MPISRKRFSKKRLSKKSIKKNTRKYKKRTPHRKYKRNSRRLRFFGGFGEDDDCAICSEPLTVGATFTTNCNHIFHRACIERWCDGKRECTCPTCRTILDPNPNPTPNPNFEQEPRIYRVKFFTFVNNPQTREIDRVPVSISNIPDPELNILEDYFLQHYPELRGDNILFYGDEFGNNPNAYIYLFGYQNNVVIDEGDMEINTVPPISVQSATITLTDGGFS